VISLTKSVKGKPSAGDNDIAENLVKECMQVIKVPLAHMYNLSLNTGVLPYTWKTTKVKLLHK